MLRDTALITALIVERAMCIECIGRRTRLSEPAAQTALQVIRRALRIECADNGKCHACGKKTRVFCVTRPEIGERLASR